MQDDSSTQFSAKPSSDKAADVADEAPTDPYFTEYDERCMAVYLTLLFSDSEGQTEAEMARSLFALDAENVPERALTAVRSHLARARWLAANPEIVLQ